MITLRLLTCLLATFLGVASSQAASIWQQATPYAVNTNSAYAPLGSVNHITSYGAPFNASLPGPDKIYTFTLAEPMVVYYSAPLNVRMFLLADSSANGGGVELGYSLYIPAGRHYIVLEWVGTGPSGSAAFNINANTGTAFTPLVSYPSSGTLTCGQTLTVPAACDGNSILFKQTPRIPYMPYSPPTAGYGFGCSRAFSFTLTQPSYIQARLRTTQYGSAFFAVSADNSNMSVLQSGGQPFQPDMLPAGTYWLMVSGWYGPLQDLPDMPVELLCSPNPIPRYQSAKPIASPLAAGNVAQGTLFNQDDHLYAYGDWQNNQGYTYGSYNPGIDRAFKYTATGRQRLTIVNRGHSNHQLIMLDSTGSTQKTLDVRATGIGGYVNQGSPTVGTSGLGPDVVVQGSSTILPGPATYYMVIEQASASVGDAFDYKLIGTCLPTVASGSAYTDQVGLNAFNTVSFPNGGYVDGVSYYVYYPAAVTFTLKVGEHNYIRTHHTAAGLYDRLFVDFNEDGDFDDAGERVFTAPGSYLDSTFLFNLSTANPTYVAANGKVLNMRLLSVPTATIGSACGTFGAGSVIDMQAIIQVSPPYANGGDYAWARLAEGWGDDNFSRVRTAPDGTLYGSLNYDAKSVQWQNYNTVCDVNIYGLPGAKNQDYHTHATGDDHSPLYSRSAIIKYGKDGSIKWVADYRCSGDMASSGTVTITGMTVDKFGYVYACGNMSGNTLTITPGKGAPATISGVHQSFSFVSKIHPDGHIMFLYNIVVGSSSSFQLTGIDVAPDLRYYVSGYFYGNATITGISGTTATMTGRGNSDAFLAKFSDQGNLYWVIQAGGTGNDYAYGAAADKLGGGYLMGSYEGTAAFNSTQAGNTPISKTAVGGSDGYVLGVAQSGALSWVASMGGTANENVRDVAPDPRGTGVVAVGGFSNMASFGATSLTATGYYDAFAVRLSNAGAFQWAKKAGSLGQDQAYSVRLDHSGNAWVGLSFAYNISSAFGGRALTATAGQNGAFVRLNAATGVLGASDPASVLPNAGIVNLDTVDAGGAAVGGSFAGGDGMFAGNFSTFGRLGTIASVGGYQLTGIGSAGSTAFITRFSNYVPGLTRVAYKEENKNLRQGVEEVGVAGLHVYPNPSSGIVSLRLKGLADGTYPLMVTDATGRLAHTATLPAEALAEGCRLDTRLAPGLYNLRIAGKTCRVVIE